MRPRLAGDNRVHHSHALGLKCLKAGCEEPEATEAGKESKKGGGPAGLATPRPVRTGVRESCCGSFPVTSALPLSACYQQHPPHQSCQSIWPRGTNVGAERPGPSGVVAFSLTSAEMWLGEPDVQMLPMSCTPQLIILLRLEIKPQIAQQLQKSLYEFLPWTCW